MKKRIVLVIILMAAFLLTSGTRPALADPLSGVTGGAGFIPPNWGDYFRVWIEIDAHQLDPSTYAADGKITARVFNPAMGWKRLWYDVKCVSFGEEAGKPTATIVAQITRREGWEDIPNSGDPGEYLKWQIVDGGTPGAGDKIWDEWRLQYYNYNEWVEYWPDEPGCSDFTADDYNNVDYGNLTIH